MAHWESQWFIFHKTLEVDHLAWMSSQYWPTLVFFPFCILVWLLFQWKLFYSVNISSLFNYVDYFALFFFLKWYAHIIWKTWRPERILVPRCWTRNTLWHFLLKMDQSSINMAFVQNYRTRSSIYSIKNGTVTFNV